MHNSTDEQMKRIKYRSIETIRQKYIVAMSGAIDEPEWQRVRADLIRLVHDFTDDNLPLHHKDVLVADFRTLAKIYVIYCNSNVKGNHNNLHKELEQLFNYDFKAFQILSVPISDVSLLITRTYSEFRHVITVTCRT